MPTFFYCYFLGYNRALKFKELKWKNIISSVLNGIVAEEC